ncbi:MAG TPA: GNAT family N-acyltransferase [Bryobacteraceae bacterium]|jgi:putative hemolysin|nr:GNAT family N-acyltransferase [Bryobacteraceae bacterium]
MAFESFPSNRLPAPLASAVNHFLQIDRLEDLYTRAQAEHGFVRRLLDDLQVQVNVRDSDFDKIPRTGPVVAVANHPFGILDDVMLADLLTRARPDVRILTNQLLSDLPELARICIFIDPFEHTVSEQRETRIANGGTLKQAIKHLRGGGMLLIFPAGEVSHFDLKKRAICDPEWNTTAARLIRVTRAKALPILIRGANGIPFQMLGMVHPKLRTAALPVEMLNKRGKSVEIRIGGEIALSRIEALPDNEQATRYLRLRTELLERRGVSELRSHGESLPVAPETPLDLLANEIAALPEDCRMEDTRELAVYLAEARRIPLALQEIGRLREITFREAGEGTGEPTDLDRFDPHYLHLFLWNKERREIAGAYRIGEVPKILARFGHKGLYTDSLFRFKWGFFSQLSPSLELGRSFIRPEYQRAFAPLLLLWKGIAGFVAGHPEYSTLIGAVSVSNQYSLASRELIARYFEKQNAAGPWRDAVRARRPLRRNAVRKWEMGALCSLLPDVDDLSAPIADLEPDGKGIPILVKQYVKLGGKLLAFSVDPQFGNTLDGFVMVDLTRTSPEILARYMGKDRAGEFFAWHRTPHPRVA